MESERRQIVFAAAIGLPAFYVRRDTDNRFLRRVLEGTARVRSFHALNGGVCRAPGQRSIV